MGKAVGAHGRANHADAADAGFARGQYVIVAAVAVVGFLDWGFNDVRRFVVVCMAQRACRGCGIDGLSVFTPKVRSKIFASWGPWCRLCVFMGCAR